MKRTLLRAFWRIMNPLARPLAGFLPWWVLVETVGRKTGRIRRTPLATGPVVDGAMLVIAVHGRHSGWVRNLEANADVRIRHRGQWRGATATAGPLTDDELRLFNRYARTGPRVAGIDPLLVRLELR